MGVGKDKAPPVGTGPPKPGIAKIKAENENEMSPGCGYFLLNTDCWMINLVEYLQKKHLKQDNQEVTEELDVIDEAGNVVSKPEQPLTTRAHTVFKHNKIYYPIIISKNLDGSLKRVKIIGAECLPNDLQTKLLSSYKKMTQKSRKKANQMRSPSTAGSAGDCGSDSADTAGGGDGGAGMGRKSRKASKGQES